MAKKQNTRRADGLISVQVYLGTNEDGKRTYKTVYGKTQKEADEKANEIKLKLRKGLDISAENDTFEAWGTRWLRLKQHEISEGRFQTYCINFKKLSPIYKMPICKIRTCDIQEIILDLATCDRPLSEKTLKDVKSIARQTFQIAIENRVLDYNPVDAVRVPRIPKESERRALTEEERNWIETTPHRAQTAAMIMLYAGLRRGELIPLTWQDIDLNERTISINKFVEFIKGQPVVKSYGKSKKAKRVVHIPIKLAEYLNSVDRKGLLVCLSAQNTMLSQSAWRRMWSSYLIELNYRHGDFSNFISGKPKSKYDPKGVPFVIEAFTAHWLRHSFATMLYMAGVDVMTARDQLGHEDIKTTLEIYTHLDGEHKKKNIDLLDSYLQKKDDKEICK